MSNPNPKPAEPTEDQPGGTSTSSSSGTTSGDQNAPAEPTEPEPGGGR
ncbi:MAG TPA: hypothetical protein VFU83_00510 [Pyrinomonadaceae bacterium]|nr:hypothetical protein [Pyrinomonadaceae bacterium]